MPCSLIGPSPEQLQEIGSCPTFSHLPQRLQEAAALIDDFCNTLGLDLAAREKDNLINQQARG